jgi:hypothetical protein
VKGVVLILTAVALSSGLAGASGTIAQPTLSFTISPSVSDYDLFHAPLGAGICLGKTRVTELEPDGGVEWSPDGRRVAFDRQTGVLTSDVFVADANGSRLRNLTRGSAEYSWAPDWSPTGSELSTSPRTKPSSGS